MKKMFFFMSVCLLFMISSLYAQVKPHTEQIDFPSKSLRFAVVAEGNFNSSDYPGRYGVGAAGKLMMKAQRNKDVYNEYVITFRASHSPATNGSFLKGFDGGNYNNLSAVLLMGGYRFNFGIPRYMVHHFNDDEGGWFIEVNAGAAYTHYNRTFVPAVSPVIGYAVAPHIDFVTSFIASWALRKDAAPGVFSKNTSLFINGIGIQYSF